jgi:hypothetical protein
MNNFVKIQDRESLVRDMTSGAVINTDTAEYLNYLMRRDASRKMKDQIQQNSQEIAEIKNDISEIKQLLISLINKEK